MYTTQNAIDSCETMLLRREDINIDAPIGGLAYTLRRVIPRLKTLSAHEAHGLAPEQVAEVAKEREELRAKYDEAREGLREFVYSVTHERGDKVWVEEVITREELAKLRRIAEDTQEG